MGKVVVRFLKKEPTADAQGKMVLTAEEEQKLTEHFGRELRILTQGENLLDRGRAGQRPLRSGPPPRHRAGRSPVHVSDQAAPERHRHAGGQTRRSPRSHDGNRGDQEFPARPIQGRHGPGPQQSRGRIPPAGRHGRHPHDRGRRSPQGTRPVSVAGQQPRHSPAALPGLLYVEVSHVEKSCDGVQGRRE